MDCPRPLPAPKTCRHGIVSGIIIPPNFRPAPALLHGEKRILRWPGPCGSGFLSPQPPGVVRIGPVRRIVIPTGPTRVGPFSFWGCWIGRLSAPRQALSARGMTIEAPTFSQLHTALRQGEFATAILAAPD